MKIVDFGLVKESTEAPGAGISQGETTIDGTTIVGTPLYMAPEQARGDPVDHRADMYSLGATLHHLVSGRPPFEGQTAMAIVSRHLTEPRPHVGEKRRGSRDPAPVDLLCDRLMAKDPGRRFDDYDALLAAVESFSGRTRPAGFWVRGFALVLDLLVVQLISLPVSLVAPVPDLALFLAFGLVYSILCHGRWGRTLGKAALEIEVVPAERAGRLGFRTAALRFLAQTGLLYVSLGAAAFAEQQAGEQTAGILSGVVVMLALLLYPLEGALTALRATSKRTFWDRAAGTQVRYRR